jgi:hypothetical protein
MFSWAKILSFGKGIVGAASGWLYGAAAAASIAVGTYVYVLQGQNETMRGDLAAAAGSYADLNATLERTVKTNREQNRTIAAMKRDHAAAVRALTSMHDRQMRTMRRANEILQRSLDAANTEKDGPAAAVTLDTMYDIDRMLREE